MTKRIKEFTQKGFSLILIAIIVSVVTLGSVGGYLGYTKFKAYQAQLAEKEKQDQELAKAQQEALEKSQQEIEKLREETQQKTEELTRRLEEEKLKRGTAETQMKSEQEASQQKISEQEQKIEESSQKLEITASELEPYLDGIVSVACWGKSGKKEGSGSLWNFTTPYISLKNTILTNLHVIGEGKSCIIASYDDSNMAIGVYDLDSKIHTFNTNADVAILKILKASENSKPISSLNYKISTLRKCSTKMPLGSPLVIIGYPAFAKQEVNLPNLPSDLGTVTFTFRSVTNGIISAYDTSATYPLGKLLYSNYLISAKIDSGNSGGIALSKNEDGLCLLGIPTWLSLGVFETQGIVQNIHNVMYASGSGKLITPANVRFVAPDNSLFRSVNHNFSFDKIKFTGGSEDIIISKILITQDGSSADTYWSSIKLYDGVTQLGTTQFLSNHVDKITFSGFSLKIPANSTKYLTLKGNVSANRMTIIKLGIYTASDITATAEVSGDFPIWSEPEVIMTY